MNLSVDLPPWLCPRPAPVTQGRAVLLLTLPQDLAEEAEAQTLERELRRLKRQEARKGEYSRRPR